MMWLLEHQVEAIVLMELNDLPIVGCVVRQIYVGPFTDLLDNNSVTRETSTSISNTSIRIGNTTNPRHK